MMKMLSLKSVLIISDSRTFSDNIKLILPPDEFEISFASNGSEARRLIVTRHFDILVINAPLSDEHGLSFALDFIDSTMGILMICPDSIYEGLSYEAEEAGIVLLTSSNPPAFIYVALKMIASMIKRLETLEHKNKILSDKMADFRIVNKAKWALIEKKQMTEGEAHKYIEKRAMDHRISSKDAAEEILDLLGE